MSHRKSPFARSSAAELFDLVTLRLASDRSRRSTARGKARGPTTNQNEAVHQLRVSLRKARTALKLFEPSLPRERYRAANRRLRTLAHRYDAARDLAVLRCEILPRLLGGISDPSRTRLDATIRAATEATTRTVPTGWLDGDRIKTEVAAAAPRSRPTRAGRKLSHRFLQERLDELSARARRRLRRASPDDRPALHRLRIALKQYRDAQSLSRDFLPRRQRIDLAPLRRATAALGELQDFERARALLTSFVREDPRLAETVTAAVLQLESLHRKNAPEALRLARRALRKSARKS